MSDTTTKLPREEKLDRNIEKYSYKKVIEEVRKTYDSLAEVYDYFYPPISVKTNHFMQGIHNFLQESGVKRILDCACGTGRELIPLAETGCYQLIVGSDLSSKMLKKGRQKALKLPIKWVQSDWLELPEKVKYKDFDAILCLGNPLAHILSVFYKDVFSSFHQLLRESGVLLVNRRNWEAELGQGNFHYNKPESTIYQQVPRISFVNRVEKGAYEYLAYFTYHNYTTNQRLQLLHLLQINKDGLTKEAVFKFNCYYVSRGAVEDALVGAGFKNVASVSELENLEGFDAYAEEIFIRGVK